MEWDFRPDHSDGQTYTPFAATAPDDVGPLSDEKTSARQRTSPPLHNKGGAPAKAKAGATKTWTPKMAVPRDLQKPQVSPPKNVGGATWATSCRA